MNMEDQDDIMSIQKTSFNIYISICRRTYDLQKTRFLTVYINADTIVFIVLLLIFLHCIFIYTKQCQDIINKIFTL
jgi:hypothetical protein